MGVICPNLSHATPTPHPGPGISLGTMVPLPLSSEGSQRPQSTVLGGHCRPLKHGCLSVCSYACTCTCAPRHTCTRTHMCAHLPQSQPHSPSPVCFRSHQGHPEPRRQAPGPGPWRQPRATGIPTFARKAFAKWGEVRTTLVKNCAYILFNVSYFVSGIESL